MYFTSFRCQRTLFRGCYTNLESNGLVGGFLPDNESIFQWEDVHTFKKVFVETNMGEILKNVVKDHLCHVWIGLAIKAARVD